MRTFSRSFAGGEVTPELFGRLDDVRFQTGLATVQNFVTLPHGPARKRPGTEYIATTKYAGSGKTRGLRFVFSKTQSLYVECSATATASDGRFRFFNQGVPVMVTDSGVPTTYVRQSAFTNASIAAAQITFGAAHDFSSGDPVYVTNDAGVNAELPLGFFGGDTFTKNTKLYVNKVSGLIVSLARTAADAIAGTNLLNLTNLQVVVGNYRLNYAYQAGDLVEGTIVGVAGYHYCIKNPSNNVATSAGSNQRDPSTGAGTYWFAEPVSGIYEVPHTFIQDNLPLIRYWSANDVITLLHNDFVVQELRRYGTARWVFAAVSFAPSLEAPVATVAATQGGVSLVVDVIGQANPLYVNFKSGLGLVSGDGLYGSMTWATGSLPLGFYRAGDVVGINAQILNVNGTTINTSTFGAFTSGNGSFRVVPLYSDLTNSYKVTAVDSKGGESVGSAVVSVANNLNAEAAYNTVTWLAVSGAAQYRIYRLSNGLYGLIGSVDSATLSFKDDNLDVQLDKTPPVLDSSLSSALPEAGCYHEQRRVFARGQSVWMTRTGTESDMTYSIPTRDDDRVTFPIAANERCDIQHLVSLGDALIALTDTVEYAIVSPDDTIITPTSVMPRPQSYVGASATRPVLANSSVVYAASSGGHVRELAYQVTSQGFNSNDLSLRAVHLFDGYTISGLAYCKAPYSIVWASSSSGKLLGLTYVPDQQVTGWHQHPLGGAGFVEDIVSVPENGEERLYLVVLRTINGVATRCIERMASMRSTTQFLDCHKVSTNVAAGVVSGYAHLAGASVEILADGIALPAQTVTASGQITMPSTQSTYANVTVGFALDARLKSLPMVLQTEGFGQADRKNVSKVWVRLDSSAPVFIGPTSTDVSPSHADAPSVRGLLVAETMRTGPIPVRVPGTWSDDGQVHIVSRSPLPCTVVALTFEMSAG